MLVPWRSEGQLVCGRTTHEQALPNVVAELAIVTFCGSCSRCSSLSRNSATPQFAKVRQRSPPAARCPTSRRGRRPAAPRRQTAVAKAFGARSFKGHSIHHHHVAAASRPHHRPLPRPRPRPRPLAAPSLAPLALNTPMVDRNPRSFRLSRKASSAAAASAAARSSGSIAASSASLFAASSASA